MSKNAVNILESENSDINNAIEIKDVSVAYRSYKERPTSLKESLLRILTKGEFRHHSFFDALSGVSFNVKKGQILGIIGSNGSGKSTLLKVIAGVLKPSQGSVKISGAIASLIELGAGFDPELNAIENIYLHASLHRKVKSEIKERVDSILEFAELTEFAHTPVKYYSSGMFARLGFSAAIDINPDILIIDEILSVGDDRFQQKSSEAIQKFLNSGKTIILVSHDLAMLAKTCQKMLLLSRGHLMFEGPPDEAIAKYHDSKYQTALS